MQNCQNTDYKRIKKQARRNHLSRYRCIVSVEEQAAPSDLRQGRKSYKIRKGLRGKLGRFTEVSKDEFIEYINGLSAAELSRVSLSIDNDDEVSQFVANKLVEAKVNPIQEKLKIDDQEL